MTDVNDAGGQTTVDDIVAAGGDARYLHADVSKAADAEAMVDLAETAFGGLGILFNNAGIMHGDDGNAMQTSEAVWDLAMNINLKGLSGMPVWHSCPQRRGGSIINTASFVAVLGAATPQLAYTASKGGVLAMTRELAVIRRENINCNALCPGPLQLLADFLDTDAKKRRRLVRPDGRFGYGRDGESGIVLASDDSSYVTGADFLVDGSITAAYVTLSN